MKLTRAEVEHVAHLARLDLTNDEIERYREQLSAVLEYAEGLNELDTTSHPADGDGSAAAHSVARRRTAAVIPGR